MLSSARVHSNGTSERASFLRMHAMSMSSQQALRHCRRVSVESTQNEAQSPASHGSSNSCLDSRVFKSQSIMGLLPKYRNTVLHSLLEESLLYDLSAMQDINVSASPFKNLQEPERRHSKPLCLQRCVSLRFASTLLDCLKTLSLLVLQLQ